jgi:hypothetical protein
MFLKDPDSTLDYSVDWRGASAAELSIQSSEWAVEPLHAAGLGIVSDSRAGMIASARISGGVAGMLYRVMNRVRFTDGSVDERTLAIRVEER